MGLLKRILQNFEFGLFLSCFLNNKVLFNVLCFVWKTLENLRNFFNFEFFFSVLYFVIFNEHFSSFLLFLIYIHCGRFVFIRAEIFDRGYVWLQFLFESLLPQGFLWILSENLLKIHLEDIYRLLVDLELCKQIFLSFFRTFTTTW